jgi:hypothetical protein
MIDCERACSTCKWVSVLEALLVEWNRILFGYDGYAGLFEQGNHDSATVLLFAVYVHPAQSARWTSFFTYDQPRRDKFHNAKCFPSTANETLGPVLTGFVDNTCQTGKDLSAITPLKTTARARYSEPSEKLRAYRHENDL